MKNLTNLTSETIILTDFHGVSVLPGETIDGLAFGESDLRASEDVIHNLLHSLMSLSDGTNTWTGIKALDILRGYTAQTTPDGKMIVTTSDRPPNTYRYYSSKGDNLQTGKIGEGAHMTFWVPPGEMMSIDVQYIENIWAKDGQAHYHGVEDHCHLDVVVVCPAGVPFEAPSHDGNYDFDGTQWIANTTNSGKYFIIGSETVVYRFVNKYPLMKNANFAYIDVPEPQFLPTPYILRTIVHNGNATDHIRVCCVYGSYRVHTIN